MKKRDGFTLAEVLITLGIIGIVAVMTIPTLINNYQKAQYVTGLKKAYTEFNQALIQIAADNGCVGDLKCTGLFDTATTQESLGNELVKYFNVVKNCESSDGGPTTTGCFPSSVGTNYDGSGGRMNCDTIDNYRFITADGMAVWIDNGKKNCTKNYSRNITYQMTQWCAGVMIDVNGLKGPNNRGRDIFYLGITNGRGPSLYPVGGKDDQYHISWNGWSGIPQACYSGNPNGTRCAGRVVDEGWQMNY